MRKALFWLWMSLVLGLGACTNDPQATATTSNEEPTPPVEIPEPGIRSYGQQILSVDEPFVRHYVGQRESGAVLDLVLVNWGGGFLSGQQYDEQGKELFDLIGEINLDESVVLRLYEGEKERTEQFVFQFDNLDTLHGSWRAEESAAPEKFQIIAQQDSKAPPRNWSGNWFYNSIWDDGSLIIGDVRDSSFYFALSVTRFTHSGEIDGRARIQGDSAIFYNQPEESYSDEPCVLHFTLLKDRIELQQRSSTSACGFGMRAYATGTYDNRIIDTEAQLSFGNEFSAFATAQQHDDFKAWIGKDSYQKIAENMQMSESEAYQNTAEKIDGILTEGLVMGLFTTDEAIILHDKQSGFWAATIDPVDSESGEFQVLYFTNQGAWKKRLPQAFENWRQSFPEYPVVYVK